LRRKRGDGVRALVVRRIGAAGQAQANRQERAMRRRAFLSGALATGAGFGLRGARAEAYPNPTRPIRLIVPFAAGGGVDVLGRLYAEKLKEMHGVTVVVENRAGGNGSIGAAVVLQAPPDGYPLLFSASTHPLPPLAMRN